MKNHLIISTVVCIMTLGLVTPTWASDFDILRTKAGAEIVVAPTGKYLVNTYKATLPNEGLKLFNPTKDNVFIRFEAGDGSGLKTLEVAIVSGCFVAKKHGFRVEDPGCGVTMTFYSDTEAMGIPLNAFMGTITTPDKALNAYLTYTAETQERLSIGQLKSLIQAVGGRKADIVVVGAAIYGADSPSDVETTSKLGL